MSWRIEQAEAFREPVEHFSDAERTILADAHRRCCATDPSRPPPPRWYLPVPRSARRDAYALVLPRVAVGDQVLADSFVVHAVDLIGRG